MAIADLLGEGGLLNQAIDGFIPREAQIQMAHAIHDALERQDSLIVEAGTGIGKTYAYLIPLFLSEKKAIISTGTKNLQDQLFFKDIPALKKILPHPQHIMLLKGRVNYLCKYRMEQSLRDGRFGKRELVAQLHTIHQWSMLTQTGELSELSSVPEDSAIWPYVTSTAENCINQECPFYKECFVVKVRQKALKADVLVVNHHLFFADMALQQEGFGELLPGCDVVIFDEAHHLPEIAAQFFSTSLSSRQLIELARDIESESLESAQDCASIVESAAVLQKVTHDMRQSLGEEVKRSAWPRSLTLECQMRIAQIKEMLMDIEAQLKTLAVRSPGLENVWKRAVELRQRFIVLTGEPPADTIHWYETFATRFTLQMTPMVVSEQFNQFLQTKKCSFVFTSATLSVNNSFQLFSETLGLTHMKTLQLESPFDYENQALLYVPRGLPDPNTESYLPKMIDAIRPILHLSQGKTFILFTSHKAMNLAEGLLRDTIPFPILLQGTQPKRLLIEQFISLGNAVLLGTSSFWYGIDVRGETLSIVIIDRLPFASPEDPLLQAKIQMLRKKGVDAFLKIQLPNAILMLKQGAGRLIRDHKDKGILMICDPRLVGSRYGEAFVQSLPPMTRTREIAKVASFLRVQYPYETISD